MTSNASARFFKGCRKLREVTIASHVGCNRRLNGELKAFSQAMTVIDEDWNRKDAGVHQVLTVAKAVQESGVALDSLTISYVSQELFDTSHSAFRALVRPLRRLRIAIHALPPRRVQCGDLYDSDRDDDIDDDDNEAGEGEGPRNAQYVVRMNHLRELLAEAHELRVLNLQPALNDVHVRSFGGARLEDAVGDAIYSHLYELSISMCEVETKYLVDLILRHKATLRRLSLCSLHLTTKDQSDWQTIFTMLSAQLPRLHVVKLAGDFLINRLVDFSLDSDPRTTHSYRDALEDFVLNGGEWPQELSPVMRPEGREMLPEIPDDYMQLDDPALDYDSDEFDF